MIAAAVARDLSAGRLRDTGHVARRAGRRICGRRRGGQCARGLRSHVANVVLTVGLDLTGARAVTGLDGDLAGEITLMVHRVAALLRERLSPDGLTVLQSSGAGEPGAGVRHLHIHVVPRWDGNGHVQWPTPSAAKLDLTELASRLSA